MLGGHELGYMGAVLPIRIFTADNLVIYNISRWRAHLVMDAQFQKGKRSRAPSNGSDATDERNNLQILKTPHTLANGHDDFFLRQSHHPCLDMLQKLGRHFAETTLLTVLSRFKSEITTFSVTRCAQLETSQCELCQNRDCLSFVYLS